MRPADVTPAIAERLLDMVYSAIKIAGPSKFKVGNSVRVSKYKIFEKDYTSNWTTEMCTIVKIQRTNPVTYLLEDYRGKFVAEANMSCIVLLIRTCISWRKYCAGKEIRCTSSGWDSMDHTIHKNTYTHE